MKKNVGNIDRVARVVLAILISVLYFTDVITGTLGIVFMVFAGVFALTSLIKSCPLYSIFGINTCPLKKQKA